MGDDLGAGTGEVHAAARDVLAFWFKEITPEQQFAKDDAVDAAIATRFGALRDAVLERGAAGWRGDADTLLAAIVLLDQFSRNMHRGSAAAFAADPLALELALSGIAAGYHRDLPPDRCAFLYMPLMHAEDRGVQRFSVRCYEALGRPENLKFARDHADVIERFGRYPSRNQALGRVSTPGEEVYLSQPDAGW